MPPDLGTTLALTALIQCLVHDLARPGGEAPSVDEAAGLIIRQNRWKALRHGLDADLVDPSGGLSRSARCRIGDLATRLQGTAGQLGCARHLENARTIARGPGGSGRQLAVFQETGSTVAVARSLAGHPTAGPGLSKLNPPSTPWPAESWGAAALG